MTNMDDNMEDNRLMTLARLSGLPWVTRTKCRMKFFVPTNGTMEAMKAVNNFADFAGTDRWKEFAKKPLLWLYGIAGVGKTHLALACAWDWLELGFSVHYCQAEELLSELQAIMSEYERQSVRLNYIHRCQLLIIDDIGAHNPSPWRTSQLDALVDYRYREELPLILTSNTVSLTERIVDRCRDGVTVHVKGKTWRGKEEEHGEHTEDNPEG